MKTIILSADTVINGTFYRKREVVVVPDEWNTNIRTVVRSAVEMKAIEDLQRTRLINTEQRQRTQTTDPRIR